MKQKKDIRITLRLTQEQYKSISEKADAAQMTIGAYVRAAALRHKVVIVDGLREYTRELKGVGRSLNQLAILAHADAAGRSAEEGAASGEDDRTGWEAEREFFFSAQNQTSQTASATHQYSGIDLSADGGGSTTSALVVLGHRLEQLRPAEPVIIGKQEWEQVQRLLKQQARPANGNQAKHRYAGLLTCRECGNAFIPMIRCWNGKSRVEYVCRGYHRNGKTYCSSHRIHEEVLDAEVQACAETAREQCAEEVEKLAQLQKMWALRKPILDAHILSLQGRIQGLEQEIDEIVMKKLSNEQFHSYPANWVIFKKLEKVR